MTFADTHLTARCVLFASAHASVSVSQISWTHADPTVFLFHRSSNTPSANVTYGLDSTETESEGGEERGTGRKAWTDKEVTTEKKERVEVFCCLFYFVYSCADKNSLPGIFLHFASERNKNLAAQVWDYPAVAAQTLVLLTTLLFYWFCKSFNSFE